MFKEKNLRKQHKFAWHINWVTYSWLIIFVLTRSSYKFEVTMHADIYSGNVANLVFIWILAGESVFFKKYLNFVLMYFVHIILVFCKYQGARFMDPECLHCRDKCIPQIIKKSKAHVIETNVM